MKLKETQNGCWELISLALLVTVEGHVARWGHLAVELWRFLFSGWRSEEMWNMPFPWVHWHAKRSGKKQISMILKLVGPNLRLSYPPGTLYKNLKYSSRSRVLCFVLDWHPVLGSEEISDNPFQSNPLFGSSPERSSLFGDSEKGRYFELIDLPSDIPRVRANVFIDRALRE